MTFDPSINLGTVIAVGAVIVTLYSMHRANIERFISLEHKVDQMWRAYMRNSFSSIYRDEDES